MNDLNKDHWKDGVSYSKESEDELLVPALFDNLDAS